MTETTEKDNVIQLPLEVCYKAIVMDEFKKSLEEEEKKHMIKSAVRSLKTKIILIFAFVMSFSNILLAIFNSHH